MCGIAGILHTDGAPVSADALATMLAALAHRGPDGSGTSVRGALGLGHRRLAIIDPAGGRQPLTSMDGAIEAVVNGEIYNYRELTAELSAKGHRFATRCDSEVVVHAYAEWGDAGLERLRGMYALAIADHRRGRLLLARDPFGIKPLHWLRQGTRVAFASELQALRTVPGLDWRLDRTAIDQYLQLQYIPAPRTAFQDVSKLEPGERVAFAFAGGAMERRRHLPPAFAPEGDRPLAAWLEEAAATLDESVRAHLVSDVPFGAFLSGGVDSSLVVGAMARALGRPVRTFSIGFADAHGAIDAVHDETRHAEAVARRWGTEHQMELVTPASFSVLPELVRHHGEPFGDSSAVPTDAVARLARRSVAMVLSGDGADELFAGYDSYRDWWRWLRGDGVPPLR
nr:asparagine synthase (glutamine-hydrolyzing) [Planctomycetota bacterium]